MPIYEFTPVDPSHHDWEGSELKGRCGVHAPDEQRALHYVRAWLDPDLYELKGVASGPLPEYREGLIETYRRRGTSLSGTVAGPFRRPLADGRRGQWVPFNEDWLTPFSQPMDKIDNPNTGRPWSQGNWDDGSWDEATWSDASTEDEQSTEPEAIEETTTATVSIDVGVSAEVQREEIQDALEAMRQNFEGRPQGLIAHARMAKATTTAALEMLDEVRGNSDQHVKARALLAQQIEDLSIIEEALSSEGSKEAAFNRYAELLHKILTNLLEVISEKGVIRSALAVAVCGLVPMTGIGGDFIIGPMVAGSILGWDHKLLVKLVDGLGKYRSTRKEDDED